MFSLGIAPNARRLRSPERKRIRSPFISSRSECFEINVRRIRSLAAIIAISVVYGGRAIGVSTGWANGRTDRPAVAEFPRSRVAAVDLSVEPFGGFSPVLPELAGNLIPVGYT